MAKNPRLITIVGGSGFLGTYAVRALANQGYTIQVLCRDTVAARVLCPLGDVGQIVPRYFDLNRPKDLAGLLAGSYGVVNLVGALFEKGSQRFDALHHRGAAALAQAAKAAGVSRFVQISALGVDRAERSDYARTKLQGEQAVLSAFPDATILRPSVVFGREDKFFNQFAAMARLGILPLIGGGKTNFQPVYVVDVASAIAAALKENSALGHSYELAGPERVSMKDIYAFIARILGRDVLYVPIPFGLAGIIGGFGQFLPQPPLTPDQVRLLKYDSVATAGRPGLRELGIEPTAFELIVPEYLDRFRLRDAAGA